MNNGNGEVAEPERDLERLIERLERGVVADGSAVTASSRVLRPLALGCGLLGGALLAIAAIGIVGLGPLAG